MKHDLGKNSSIDFLKWLRDRLKNKYDEEQTVINNLDSIIYSKKIIDKSIDVSLVEKICEKFWAGFNESTSEYFGAIDKYGENEKNEIRSLVLKILVEARKDGACA